MAEAVVFESRLVVYVPVDWRQSLPSGDWALVACHLDYWFSATAGEKRPRARFRHEGKRWLVRSYSELADETGVPRGTVRRIVASFERKGNIETTLAKFRGRTSKAIRLLRWPRSERNKGVLVPLAVRLMTGDGDRALVLAQVLYWFRRPEGQRRPRVRLNFDGAYWLAKTHDELADETGVPIYTVKRGAGLAAAPGAPDRHVSRIWRQAHDARPSLCHGYRGGLREH